MNTVAPGFIPVERHAQVPADDLADYRSTVLGCRMGTPDDVAHAVSFRASERAGFITGQRIVVDGGAAAPSFPEPEFSRTNQVRLPCESGRLQVRLLSRQTASGPRAPRMRREPGLLSFVSPHSGTRPRTILPGQGATELPIKDAGQSNTVPRSGAEYAGETSNATRGHELDGFLSASHGFLPKTPPVRAFPESHRAWDDIVREMPSLWRTVRLRQALQAIPVLGAGPEELADDFVWRASVALSVFAHAYMKVESLSAAELPLSVAAPWEEISERLQRRRPHMSYNDLIVYNHMHRDPASPDPYRVDNMDLLVPSVDNREERRFYLAQVEILARSIPVVSAVVRAQEAVLNDDPQALAVELNLMLEAWQTIIEQSFRQIDPNPLSPTYVDQVIWAKTVAPLAVPIKSGTAGPGGEASPIFHLMDAFLGRKHKKSRLGREVAELREWFPSHHITFIEAVEKVSVREYVAGSGNARLQNLFATLFETYAGRRGYLGVHRMKIYGFLELAFKVGRNKTITGFVGGFKEKHWKTLDEILEETRLERYLELPPHVQRAQLAARTDAAPDGGVTHVLLDARETGVIYRPGDRCGVLPVNSVETVDRIVGLLGASGYEQVRLTAAWREAVRYRALRHSSDTDELPLREFLTFAKLRPLELGWVRTMSEATASPALSRLADTGEVEQWEFLDALITLRDGGFDLTRLLRQDIGDPCSLARLLPPEDFRMYSVSSSSTVEGTQLSDDLRLTVGHLRHRPADSGPRAGEGDLVGTASTYLTGGQAEDSLSIRIIRPSRFRLPRDSRHAVVMFAAGVGIAPFLGFLSARRSDPSSGRNWLFYGARSRHHIYGEAEITAAVEHGKLSARLAFSAEPGGLRSGFGGPLHEVDHSSGRLPGVLRADPAARAELWELMRPVTQGGIGAHFYICGRAEFASDVLELLTTVSEQFGDSGVDPHVALRQLAADGRLMQDVFTSWSPMPAGERLYDVSEVARHTSADVGQWVILKDRVYDLTRFLHLHPGGPRILTENVGLDATGEYQAVLHHENSEIEAMLSSYRIGRVRPLELDEEPRAVVVPGQGLVDMSCRELYDGWVRLLHLLTAMSNALDNDWDFMSGALTRGDTPAEMNTLKLHHASNTHRRFVDSYYIEVLENELPHLADVAGQLTGCDRLRSGISQAIARAMRDTDAKSADQLSDTFSTVYKSIADNELAVTDGAWAGWRAVCATIQRHDVAVLADLRSTVREGVIVFEKRERRALSAGDALERILVRIPSIIGRYHRSLVADVAAVWPAEPAPLRRHSSCETTKSS